MSRETPVFVVVLNWNQERDTRECLESLRQCGSPMRVILVDNGSRDDSPRRLATDFPDVEILCQPRNLGFAEGNNVGLRRALGLGAERIMLLNNDTLVLPGFLEPLCAALERYGDVGIVGPKIYYDDEARTLWAAGATIDWERGRQFHIGAGEADHGQYDVERDVDYVSACCLLARREVFERAGLLDPRYFIYFEETAWSMRARACGFGIRYVPTASIRHKVSAAMKGDSPNTAYYMTRNRLLFLTEHGPADRRRFYRYFFTTRPLRYGLGLILRGRVQRGRAVLQALWDFHIGRFGERRTRIT
jgi:GT2 family glycosyltransferase